MAALYEEGHSKYHSECTANATAMGPRDRKVTTGKLAIISYRVSKMDDGFKSSWDDVLGRVVLPEEIGRNKIETRFRV